MSDPKEIIEVEGVENAMSPSGSSASSLPADPHNIQELTQFIQNLLQQTQDKFQRMSEQIINRIDDMGRRIDDLERNISELMTQAGVDELENNKENSK